MRGTAIVMLSALLPSCASLQAERQQTRLYQAHGICQSAGFHADQPGYGQCVLQAYEGVTAQSQANSAAMMAVGLELMRQSQPPPPPPRPVVCRQMAIGMVCQ